MSTFYFLISSSFKNNAPFLWEFLPFSSVGLLSPFIWRNFYIWIFISFSMYPAVSKHSIKIWWFLLDEIVDLSLMIWVVSSCTLWWNVSCLGPYCLNSSIFMKYYCRKNMNKNISQFCFHSFNIILKIWEHVHKKIYIANKLFNRYLFQINSQLVVNLFDR